MTVSVNKLKFDNRELKAATDISEDFKVILVFR